MRCSPVAPRRRSLQRGPVEKNRQIGKTFVNGRKPFGDGEASRLREERGEICLSFYYFHSRIFLVNFLMSPIVLVLYFLALGEMLFTSTNIDWMVGYCRLQSDVGSTSIDLCLIMTFTYIGV